MKTAAFVLVAVFMVHSMPLASQENPLLWRGSVESDQRLFLQDEREWAWNENRLDLSLEKRVSPLHIRGNIWLRHLGPSIAETYTDLQNKEKVSPWDLDIRELYAEVHGFISENMDLTVGRQRIAWGTADRFNPTDNLNPYDLEDILDFGRAMGSDALNMQWYFTRNSSLQMVYIPRFQPASMPRGAFAGVFDLSVPVDLPNAKMLIPVNETTLILPKNNLEEGSNVGLRWRSFLLNTDFSLSYVYARDPLPLATAVDIMIDPLTNEAEASAVMEYPRHHIAGGDFSGSIRRIGIWGEAALFIPKSGFDTDITIHFAETVINEKVVALHEDPYLKYVLGADYTFSGGTYMNVQFIRGFLHESGKGELNDYFVIQTERSFLQNRLKIQPLAGGLTVSDWSNISGDYAWFITPEVTWQGIDNLEITLGGYFFDGKGNNFFVGMKDKNMLRLHVKASF
ncbi:MAG: hypothetical protein EA394_07730 [Bacteroidia bacterium]|nr:MAG: hypothetical protein EA394_07730 [Bacteroidia bacterium]